MYINAYKETYDNLYLVKGPNLLPMISYEIEKILDREYVCETAQDYLPKLQDIKQLAEKYKTTDDEVTFVQELKSYIHIETQDFKFLIEMTQNNHIWISIEYTYYDAMNMDHITYTSVIEHIDDID